MGRIAWSLTVAAAVHLLAAPAVARAASPHIANLALLSLHLVSLLLLGAVWLQLGAMNCPLFMLFFAPAVLVAPAMRGRWGGAVAFASTLTVVVLAALLASPSLRWYGAQAGMPIAILEPVAARAAALGIPTEQNAVPSTAFVSLALAATALGALYACAGTLWRVARRSVARLNAAIATLRQGEGMTLELLTSSPLAEALVMPEGLQIVLVNDRFRAQFTSEMALEGQRLLDVVRMQFPEPLQRLIESGDGVVDARHFDERERPRELRVYVRHSRLDGARVARVSFEDRTEERQLESAIDALDATLLVFDSDDNLVYANAAARALFDAAAPGASAAAILHRGDLPDRWWHTPVETSVPRHLSIGGVEYRGRVTHRKPEALAAPLTVVALQAVGTP
jgi:PAS domain-containing protein